MERVKVHCHDHPLLPITRFDRGSCEGCSSHGHIYGGYRCNDLGCGVVFHKECAESLPETNHSSHPDHPLNLKLEPSKCSLCGTHFSVGYFCSICDFKLDLGCARRPAPLLVLEKSNAHEHPLELIHETKSIMGAKDCIGCHSLIFGGNYYTFYQCKLFFHVACVKAFPEAYHTSHPEHPLKFLTIEAPDYTDKRCFLCRLNLNQLHHCDVCNFSICSECMENPPPVCVVSPTTHEHQLHLVPRLIDFICNACGTQGDRSPYFCLRCNFMIHRECIDLPRVININRHHHRVSYTRRLGQGNWKCVVCRKKVYGFYGGYSCTKCPSFVVHSRCATKKAVWDMIELEGTTEEEEIAPFEVVDATTIRHFSHDHNLRFNKGGRILHESTLCKACVFQICSESFYCCGQCDFILHEKCANLPRKKPHVSHNKRFTLHTDYHHEVLSCTLCHGDFTGFRYESDMHKVLDVRCGSISEPFVHKSHPHPLYYSTDNAKRCTECGQKGRFSCDECDFSLDYQCAILPEKVTRHRYDDHPLFLSYGESNVDGEYWCEACESKVKPKKWFYTCNDCGITLHITCVVETFSYCMPGSVKGSFTKVLSSTSICRPLCAGCNSRCKLPLVKISSNRGVDIYLCSYQCSYKMGAL